MKNLTETGNKKIRGSSSKNITKVKETSKGNEHIQTSGNSGQVGLITGCNSNTDHTNANTGISQTVTNQTNKTNQTGPSKSNKNLVLGREIINKVDNLSSNKNLLQKPNLFLNVKRDKSLNDESTKSSKKNLLEVKPTLVTKSTSKNRIPKPNITNTNITTNKSNSSMFSNNNNNITKIINVNILKTEPKKSKTEDSLHYNHNANTNNTSYINDKSSKQNNSLIETSNKSHGLSHNSDLSTKSIESDKQKLPLPVIIENFVDLMNKMTHLISISDPKVIIEDKTSADTLESQKFILNRKLKINSMSYELDNILTDVEILKSTLPIIQNDLPYVKGFSIDGYEEDINLFTQDKEKDIVVNHNKNKHNQKQYKDDIQIDSERRLNFYNDNFEMCIKCIKDINEMVQFQNKFIENENGLNKVFNRNKEYEEFAMANIGGNINNYNCNNYNSNNSTNSNNKNNINNNISSRNTGSKILLKKSTSRLETLNDESIIDEDPRIHFPESTIGNVNKKIEKNNLNTDLNILQRLNKINKDLYFDSDDNDDTINFSNFQDMADIINTNNNNNNSRNNSSKHNSNKQEIRNQPQNKNDLNTKLISNIYNISNIQRANNIKEMKFLSASTTTTGKSVNSNEISSLSNENTDERLITKSKSDNSKESKLNIDKNTDKNTIDKSDNNDKCIVY